MIVHSINLRLRDQSILRATQIERLKIGVIRFYRRVLYSRIQEEVIDKTRLPLLTKSLLNKQNSLIKSSLNRILGLIEDSFTKQLRQLVKIEANYIIILLKELIPSDVPIIAPNNPSLKKVFDIPIMGQEYSVWWEILKRNLFENLKRQTLISSQAKENVFELRARLKTVFKSLSLSLERIFRISISHVVVQAREKVFEENKKIILGVQYEATLSKTEADKNGMISLLKQGIRPPVKFNSVAIISPVLRAWDEIGLKDLPPGKKLLLDGRPASSTSLKQWLGRLTDEERLSVLGIRKSKLWREAEVNSSFLRQNFRPITMDELKNQVVLNI